MNWMGWKALPVLLVAGWVWASAPCAGAQETAVVPPELESWKEWVLHGHEKGLCPSPYDNAGLHHCAWPSRLTLELSSSGGRFAQEWSVHAETWVPLPGGPGRWPEMVRSDGVPIPVSDRDGVPHVLLRRGSHRVEGVFSWARLPEMIRIPPATGLVDVAVDEAPLASPKRDARGRLWLAGREREEALEDRVDVRVSRLLRDTIPMRVISRLEVRVSGRAREVPLEGVLLEGSVPMRLESPVPARFDARGRLVLQARAGRWEIRIESRRPGPVRRMGPIQAPFGQEIWSFEARNHLRMVKVEGLSAVDPGQADVPAPWRGFPAFVVNPGDTARLEEIRRGDPDPAPDQLRLQRTWWLDFDGKGFTIRDEINGTMNRNWALTMNPPTELGRVQVDGMDQLITRQGKGDAAGVELRRGSLNLKADSRLEGPRRTLSAVGWDHDFQAVSARLHLPPGWRLFSASGVDVMPGTWFERWTLLDLFLVLIIAMAFWKLRGPAWGLLALVTLGLVYHEPGAPRLVWLHLAASMAILRLLSGGWFRRLVQVWFLGAIVTLLVLAVPFMVQQARVGIYPQLEQPRGWGGGGAPGLERMSRQRPAPPVAPAPMKAGDAVPAQEGTTGLAQSKSLSGYAKRPSAAYQPAKQAALVQDPDALIQTGPGLPSWTGRTLTMGWNGPVNRDQQIRLRLLPPGVNRTLAFLRVALLALLIAGLAAARSWWSRGAARTAAGAVLCVLAIPGWSEAVDTVSGSTPPRWLLEEYRQRLLEPADCFPHCAASPRMSLDMGEGGLSIRLEVHAATRTAVPLPGGLNEWSPVRVRLDDQPAAGLLRDAQGVLWILVPEGVHGVALQGPPPGRRPFQVPLPLRPRTIETRVDGWEVEGVRPDGTVEGSLQFTPKRVEGDHAPAETETVLEPYLHVTRLIRLGLDWRLETTLRRETPKGAPVVVTVPLLKGESVHTEDIRVEAGRAHVNMAPQDGIVRWVSSLDKSKEIRLRAPESVPWTETWILDASPVWHCELLGIPVIHHQDKEGFWKPEWRPWPGEEVVIKVSRPKAVSGRSVTLDGADLKWIPGKRFDKGILTLSVRTSRGGRHRIELPETSRLQVVNIDGKSLPIRLEEGGVVVPLRPGRQSVGVEWHGASAGSALTRAPEVGLGQEAVNADVRFQMPRNRWILWTSGPRLGPAVLFWTYLVVVVLAAIALGRVRWTPLRTGHWLLLGLGLTQVHPLVAVLVAGWFLALGLREKQPILEGGWLRFNAAQLLLVIWTAAALAGLYFAIQKGLLGIPDMQIAGNGSTALQLHWTQDRVPDLMPRPTVLSVPLLAFRLLMLAWALWLAFSLLGWLRWAWRCFSRDGIWRPVRRKRKTEEGVEGPELQG